MNDRDHHSARATPARPLPALGHRSTSPWSQQVMLRLHGQGGTSSDPLWSYRTRKDQWLCPYCLAVISKRPQRTYEDSIALHLDGCMRFAAGRGQTRSVADISEAYAVAELQAAVETDPVWQVHDADNLWFCPSCLGRQPTVRWRGAVDSFLILAIRRHLGVCAPYHTGSVQSLEAVHAAREHEAHIVSLARWVHQQLQFEVWRFTAYDGAWICPFSLRPQPGIRLNPAEAWLVAPTVIARYLVTCAEFDPRQPRLHSAAELVAVAGGPPQPYPGMTPTRIAASGPRVAMPLSHATQAPSSTSLTPLSSSLAQSRARLASPLPFPVATVAQPPPLVAAESETEAEPPNLAWMDDLDTSRGDTARQQSRYERSDVHGAVELQKSILGGMPEIPGFALASRFEPSHDITGDFYTFIALENGDTAFALGDVSGHGMQAGLVMSMTKKTIEIYARQGGTPVEVLSKVNDALADDLAGKLFISLVYGIISPERQTITWARAGHTPVLRYNLHSKEQSEIAPAGMVVGMRAGAFFRQSIAEVAQRYAPGDVFLLYTDGIIETTNRDGEEFGPERLAEILRRHASEGPEALVTHVMDHMRHFRGSGPQADDTTLLALAVL
jgi:hypothetical protein